MNLTEKLLDVYSKNEIERELKESDSWQILYHLSPMRKNLLEWYEFKSETTLLEIGAEAGAMTELFAQRVDKVVCLESNKDLATVNKQRNGQYKNVEFRIGNLQQVQADEKFDYITLIGTLEKAFEYEESYLELLKKSKEHLKEDGVLIIAIDNKTGMKYWAGAPESVTGRSFAGMGNDFKEKEGRSFTKNELERMLQKCHLEQIEFFYPTPDYRFASTLYTDEFLPQKGELRPGNPVYEADGYQFFEEDLAYDIVCEDGQYSYFADSFLIFAKNE